MKEDAWKVTLLRTGHKNPRFRKRKTEWNEDNGLIKSHFYDYLFFFLILTIQFWTANFRQ